MTQTRRDKGDGALFQRADGRWCAIVNVNGRRKYLYGVTKAAVHTKLKAAQRIVEQGAPLPDDRITVGAFLATWLTGVEGSLRPESHRRYRQLMEDHVIPTLGAKRLAKLAPEDVQTLYAAKLRGGLSNATVRMLHFVLHRALRDAVRWGRAHRNVAGLVDPPRLPQAEMPVLTPEQSDLVLAAARGHRLEALFDLAINTGLRRGELLALRWRHVDRRAGTLNVVATLQPTPRGQTPRITEPKSKRSRRPVDLDPVTVGLLDAVRVRQAAERLEAGELWENHDLVFTTPLGRPVAPMEVTRVWAELLRRVGLPHMPFHTTRHTAMLLMVLAKTDPRTASERMGHHSVGFTFDKYGHVIAAMREGTAAGVRGVLRAAAGAGLEPTADSVSNSVSGALSDAIPAAV